MGGGFATDRGRNVTFVDPRAWLGGMWTEPDSDAAHAVVAHRFFDVYGPATVDDFARWWGVAAAEGKRLLRPSTPTSSPPAARRHTWAESLHGRGPRRSYEAQLDAPVEVSWVRRLA